MNARTPTQHLTARDWCAKLRTQDLNAANAMHDASTQAVQTCISMRCITQVNEPDALILLHTLQCMVEKNGNAHGEFWQAVCESLTELQDFVQAEIAERQAYEASLVRAAGSVL